MKISGKIVDAEEIRFRMEFEMNLHEWQLLTKQLGNDYPSWRVGRAIRDMINRASEHFKADVTLYGDES